MATSPNVAARFDELDKEALVDLAIRFQRSQSDILRVLVREAVAVLREQDTQRTPQKLGRSRAITQRIKSKNLK